MMSSAYRPTRADTSPANFLSTRDFRDPQRNTAVTVTDEAVTVPASADSDGKYRVALEWIPRAIASEVVVVRTSGAVTLTHTDPDDTIGANQVGVDYELGVLVFPASAAGVAHTVSYKGIGKAPLAQWFNELLMAVGSSPEHVIASATIDLTTAGNNTLWTADRNVIPTAMELVITEADGVAANATVSCLVVSGDDIVQETELFGRTAVGKVWRFALIGGLPTIADEEVVRFVVNTASTMDTLTARVTLFGREAA